MPQNAMEAKTDTLFLTGREIAVPVACRESGRVTLLRAGNNSRVGSAYADCVGYSAVAKVRLKRKVAKVLRRALKRKSSVGLRARFVLSSETLVSRLELQRRTERSAPIQTRTGDVFQTRTGEVFGTGWLSCGRSTNLSGPGLRLFVPGTSANGNRAGFNEFYNDTASDNWVWYQPYIYEYGHGWVWSGEWRGPTYVPPYSTMFAATGEGDFLGNAEEDPSYLAGAAYIWWWDGYKDWNWVPADTPYFGYPTYDDYWCEIS